MNQSVRFRLVAMMNVSLCPVARRPSPTVGDALSASTQQVASHCSTLKAIIQSYRPCTEDDDSLGGKHYKYCTEGS